MYLTGRTCSIRANTGDFVPEIHREDLAVGPRTAHTGIQPRHRSHRHPFRIAPRLVDYHQTGTASGWFPPQTPALVDIYRNRYGHLGLVPELPRIPKEMLTNAVRGFS